MVKRNGRTTLKGLQEENRALYDGLELLQERLAELELYQEDIGWERLSSESGREFSRDGLARIIKLSRIMYLKSPVINRSVNIQALYVWAQGVSIKATDEAVNMVVQAFLDDPANRAELTSHQARTLKEVDLQVLGNLFFVFFVDPAAGAVRVRTIPVEEIQDIVTNPEDAKEAWYYKRVWTQTTVDGTSQYRTTYYPDWHLPKDAPRPAGVEVAEYPVYHVKVGGLSDQRFGVPETYQALDWARAYKEFLEDRATLARALSRFAFRLTTQGGPKGVAAAKAKLGTTYASGGASAETNPPPVTGSTFIAGQGVSLDPMRLSGATIHPDEGRRFLLMAATAAGLPETFFGDVSTGNLATAKSLDRPTELKFRDRQELWKEILTTILRFVVEQQAARFADGIGPATDRHIDVDFPPLLEHDIEQRIKAIVGTATLDGKKLAGTIDLRLATRMLLLALGEDDIDEEMKRLFPDGEEAGLVWEREELTPEPMAVPFGGEPTPEERFGEALRELREAVKALGHGAS